MTKHVVVTGANRGIGLAMCACFKQMGYRVTGVCRQSSNDLVDVVDLVIDSIDVSNSDDVTTLVKKLKGDTIDVLVCNAGILRDEGLGRLDLTTIRDQFEVNALAPLNMVDKLQDLMSDGGKVAMITSRMGSIEDNGSGGRYGYRMSKAALNAASMSLSHDLALREIAVGIYHPGYVQTDMVGGRGDIPAVEAAQRLTSLIDGLSMNETGVFKHSNGQVLPW